jgi:hypothetical protein
MTGFRCDELLRKAFELSDIYIKEGIGVISPVIDEHVRSLPTILEDRNDVEMAEIWEQDKRDIVISNVLVYEIPQKWSQGLVSELMYAREIKKPIVAVGTAGYIARVTHDYVAATHQEAAFVIKNRWGNPYHIFKSWFGVGIGVL